MFGKRAIHHFEEWGELFLGFGRDNHWKKLCIKLLEKGNSQALSFQPYV